jgi:hypothetical protein
MRRAIVFPRPNEPGLLRCSRAAATSIRQYSSRPAHPRARTQAARHLYRNALQETGGRETVVQGPLLPGAAARRGNVSAHTDTEERKTVERTTLVDIDWEALEAEAQTVPAHEKPGRLPRAIREKIWGADAFRCGRPRYDGKPCRHQVAEPGQTCAAHCIGNCQKCRACYLKSDEYKRWRANQ